MLAKATTCESIAQIPFVLLQRTGGFIGLGINHIEFHEIPSLATTMLLNHPSCSQNAHNEREGKDTHVGPVLPKRAALRRMRRAAWSSSCSRNAHDRNVLVRRAQSRINQAALEDKVGAEGTRGMETIFNDLACGRGVGAWSSTTRWVDAILREA